jgi:hypothetical protein
LALGTLSSWKKEKLTPLLRDNRRNTVNPIVTLHRTRVTDTAIHKQAGRAEAHHDRSDRSDHTARPTQAD